MAFISGSTLYVFADDVSFDVGADGYQPIRATIESDMMSLGAPNRKKRLTRAMLSFSAESGFLLTVTDAEGTPVDAEIRVTENERLGYYETRLPCPRSRFYSVTVTHEDGPFSLYAIALYAVK